jgi:hypothetical protein
MENKIVVRILTVVVFLLLGWFLFSFTFEFIGQYLERNHYRIATTTPLEEFRTQLFFSLIFGAIPALFWISTRFFKYKSRFFQGFGILYTAFAGYVTVLLKGFTMFTIKTNLPSYIEMIELSALKINQYLLLGILTGGLVCIGLGLLIKQITLKRN